jgi:uncharacterized protein YjbJ (UPF0337 family)
MLQPRCNYVLAFARGCKLVDENGRMPSTKGPVCGMNAAIAHRYGQPLRFRSQTMNWSEIEHRWDQMHAVVKTHWQKLSNDDVARINGKREVLAQVIQERECLNPAEAESAICIFEKEIRRPGAVK